MGLTIKSKRHGGILLTLTAVFALVAQPMYGFVAAQVATALGSVTINEVSSATSPEWVELYAPAGTNLAGWTVQFDANDTSPQKTTLSASDATDTNGLFVVETPSSWIANTGDTIKLFDGAALVQTVAVPSMTAVQSYQADYDGATTYTLSATPTKGVTNGSAPVAATGTLNTEEFITHDGTNFKGISVGFNVKDFGTVTDVTVALKRADGTTVTKTAAAGVLALASNTTSTTQLTTPFFIQEGTLAEADDAAYWNPAPVTSWSATTTPVEVTISVTDEHGTASATNSVFNQGAPSWPTYESLLPATAISNTNSGKTFDTLTEALSDPATSDGDTLSINEDLAVSTQVNVNRPIVIDGNDHTITGNFTKNGNDNNSVLAVGADNVTINNLVFDAVTPTNELHGVNTYEAANLTLNNITAKNGRTGVNINRSTVTIDGITTSGNAWHGVDIDKPGAVLTIKGSNSHTEAKALYVDDRTVGQVIDVDHQYEVNTDPALATADIYTLDTTGPNVSWQLQPEAYYGSGDGFHVRPITPEAGMTKSVYLDTVSPETLCFTLTSSHKNLDTSQSKCQSLWDGLSDGTHQFVAVFADPAGNATTRASREFTIDRTAPTVKVNLDRTSYIASGDTISKLQNGEIEARDTNLDRIELWKNGVKTGHVWTATGTKRLAGISFLGEGNYTIKAFDKAGNQSDDFNFTVDNTAPSVPTPIDTNVFVKLGVANKTLAWTHDGVDTATYEYREYTSYANAMNDTPSWTKTITAPQLSTTDTASSTSKILYWRVVAIDAVGNRSQPSDIGKITIDRNKPVVTGSTEPEFNPTSFTITATDNFGVHKVVGNIYEDSTNALLKSNSSTAENPYTVDLSTLAEGSYYVRYNAADDAGNISNTEKFNFTVDHTEPTIVLREDQTIKPSGSYFLTSKTIRIQPKDDNLGKFYVNDVEYPQYEGATSFGINWIVDKYPTVEKFVLKSEDKAGNMSAEYIVMVDRTAPTISLKTGTGALDGTLGTDPWYRQVSFKLFDANGNLKEVELNGHAYSRGGKWNDFNWVNVNKSHLMQGENTIIVRDQEGNENELKFNFDSTAPVITAKNANWNDPSVAPLASGSTVSTLINNNLRIFTAEDHIDGLKMDGDMRWQASWVAAAGGTGISWITSGTHTFQAVDKAGNVSNEITLTFDNVAPSATFDFSNNHGNALTRDDVVVTMTTSEPAQTPADWTRVNDQEFTRTYSANGKYDVTLTDMVGNVSAPQKYEVKRIDRQAPDITGVAEGAIVKGSVTLTVTDPKYQGFDGFDKNHGLRINGADVQTTEGAGKTYTYELTQSGAYEVIATDKAGNATNMLQFMIDNDAPLVTLDTFSIDPTTHVMTLGGTASDATSGLRQSNAGGAGNGRLRVSFRPVTTAGVQSPVKTFFVDVDTSGNWTLTVDPADYPELSDGEYRIVARANDNAGNSYSTSNTAAATHDATIDTADVTPGGGAGTNDNQGENTGSTGTANDDANDVQTFAAAALLGASPTGQLPVPFFGATTGTGTAATVANPAVLGTSTVEADGFSDAAVKGAADQKSADKGNWFTDALGYWWLLVVVALLGFFWWLIAALRRRAQQEV